MNKYLSLTALTGAVTAFAMDAPRKMPEAAPADRWEMSADFLWWKADVEGTEVVLAGHQSGGPTAPPKIVSANTLAPEGKWEPGVKVGLGYNFGRFDAWDLSATWTYLFTNSNTLFKTNPPYTTLSPVGSNLLGPAATSINAYWQLKTNVADLALGRTYRPSEHLALRPHAGVRGAWFNFGLHQSITGQWTYVNTLSTGLTHSLAQTADKNRFTYKAVGLRAGLDSDWEFASEWSLLAEFSGSLVYGKYNMKHDLFGFIPDPLNDGQPALIPGHLFLKDSPWRVRANLELFLGLMWKRSFCESKRELSFFAGYDLAQWFLLNSTLTYVDQVISFPAFDRSGSVGTAFDPSVSQNSVAGNVSYQGLRAGLGFSF